MPTHPHSTSRTLASSPSSSTRVRGVLPVFQTPFNDDESIDAATLEKEIHWLLDQGADGVVMAMVSETLRLSSTERDELATLACKFGSKRGAVIISVGAESSAVACQHARAAEKAGADALMAIPPISVGLGEDELEGYYRRIIQSVGIPVIVQDASGYVGRPMSIGLQAHLLDEFPDRVMYKPEAAPIGPRLTELLQATGGRAKVFEGTGGIALVDSHARGIIGTMPGADLIIALVALWKALEARDRARVDRIWMPLTTLVTLQSTLDSFLAIEKYLLVKQGIFRNTLVRGPVGYKLDEPTRKQVDYLFDAVMNAVKS